MQSRNKGVRIGYPSASVSSSSSRRRTGTDCFSFSQRERSIWRQQRAEGNGTRRSRIERLAARGADGAGGFRLVGGGHLSGFDFLPDLSADPPDGLDSAGLLSEGFESEDLDSEDFDSDDLDSPELLEASAAALFL